MVLYLYQTNGLVTRMRWIYSFPILASSSHVVGISKLQLTCRERTGRVGLDLECPESFIPYI